LEDKFWSNFCELIGLDIAGYDESTDPAGVTAAVAALIRKRTAQEWRSTFAGRDVCCTVIASVEEALQDPHFQARGLFARRLRAPGAEMTALPMPIAPQFRGDVDGKSYPSLGEGNSSILGGGT
jgi:alpha-methylacyl-CoA racemase